MDVCMPTTSLGRSTTGGGEELFDRPKAAPFRLKTLLLQAQLLLYIVWLHDMGPTSRPLPDVVAVDTQQPSFNMTRLTLYLLNKTVLAVVVVVLVPVQQRAKGCFSLRLFHEKEDQGTQNAVRRVSRPARR